jgi:biopolymer transport protein ExbD
MPIRTPGRREAFPPIGRLRAGPFGGGKRGLMMELNLTPMVDMFTVIVIFLLQSFSANGEILFTQKGLTPPKAEKAEMLSERGTAILLFENTVLMEGKPVARLAELEEDATSIAAVADPLKETREREEKLYGRDPNAPFKGFVVIQADRETDFRLVRLVIASVNEAGWANIKFVTNPKTSKKIEEGG